MLMIQNGNSSVVAIISQACDAHFFSTIVVHTVYILMT